MNEDRKKAIKDILREFRNRPIPTAKQVKKGAKANKKKDGSTEYTKDGKVVAKEPAEYDRGGYKPTDAMKSKENLEKKKKKRDKKMQDQIAMPIEVTGSY